MLKLRILLLRNSLFYFILILALLYFLVVNFFVTYKSIYDNTRVIESTIISINVKDYGIKLTLKDKEKIVGYYYLKKNQIDDFKTSFALGDLVKIEVEEQRITNNTLDNTFNYKKFLYNNKIYKVYEIKNITKIKDNTNLFYTFKNILLNRSYKLKKSYPYINTLLFGDSNDIEDDILTSYRSNGVCHLFAISGLHISIFISIIEKILKKLKIKENKRFIIMILFLFVFMFMTNFSMSVLRGSIFTILIIINKIFYFYIKPVNLLLLTLAIILFINPLNIFNIGLQYSFSISLGLLLMSDYINCHKMLRTSLISFIISLPITIYNFYEINLLSIIYNLFFVPYVSFLILPLTLISYILPFFDNILHFFLKIMEYISLFLAQINLFKIILCKPNLLIIILYYFFIIIFFKGLNKHKKGYFLCLVCLVFLNYIWPLSPKEELTFIDIGQGDSTLLNVDFTTTLIDTGGVVTVNDSKYTYKLVKNKIIPYLKSQGIRKLNNLVLTHGDTDHIKESIYLINNFKVDAIYLNSNSLNYLEKEVIKAANKNKIKVVFLKQNNIIILNKLKVYSLNTCYDNENDSSIVLYFNYHHKKVLLMGDISKKIENILIDEYNLQKLDILKLAHHGSKNSSDYKFLKIINPKYSIISAAIDNKYNHPSTEVIKNLKDLNLTYLETSQYGSITYNFKTGTFSYCLP